MAAGCSFELSTGTGLRHTVSILSSQDRMTIGSLRFTGTVAIIDRTFRVSVTAENIGTTRVPYMTGCVQHLGFALYQNAARSGTPVLDLSPLPGSPCTTGIDSLVPGGAITFTEDFPVSPVRRLDPDVYYVGVPVADFQTTVDAGTVLVSRQ